MLLRWPHVVLIASIALLIHAIAWGIGGASQASADLAGPEVPPAATGLVEPPPPTAPRELFPPAQSPPAAGGTPTADAEVRFPAVGAPARLMVPAIGVDSPVLGVGLEPDGSMELPGARQAGWYVHGATPGAPTGSAVIAAHVDFNGEPGVFLDLRALEVGAELGVLDDTGSTHRFVVTERFQVGKDGLPVDELFRRNGPPLLTLITCGGEFDRAGRSYTDNIVVRAAPI